MINLTYVLTTYNKKDYLKLILQDLFNKVAQDEEIVIVDGGSSDGTVLLLEEYYKKGLISQFISEKDFGEAHGFNKGILMAKGVIIKLISDDDVYNYEKIRKVKEFMLLNPDIDLVTGDIAYLALDKGLSISERLDVDSFLKYKKFYSPFWFNGQTLFFRKECIPLLGLLHTGMKTVDSEFSLRVTSNKHIRIGYVQDIYSVRIDNPDSNLNKYMSEILEQTNKNFIYYGYTKMNALDLSSYNLIKILVKRFINKIRSMISKIVKGSLILLRSEDKVRTVECLDISVSFKDAYKFSSQWLNEYNKGSDLLIHV